MTQPNIAHKTRATLLDQLSTAVAVINQEHQVVYINSAGEQLLRLSAERAQTAVFSDFFVDSQELCQTIALAQQNGTAYMSRQLKVKLRNHEETVFDFIVTPHTDGLITLEMYALDRILKISSAAQLYQAQASSKSLVLGLAHEIKNPLAGIQGAAQLLEKRLKDPKHEDFTQIIINETKRLSNLVDRLLIPQRQHEKRALNIHQVCERVYKLLKVEIAENTQLNVTIVRDYDPSIPQLIGDQSQLIQVVLNICRNALQALEDQANGEIMLQTRILRAFTIGNEHHKLVCEVNIHDNGPGIDAALKDTLFLPMVSSYARGSGLGLSIAQTIINQHQGIINFDSQPGATRFSIYLPLAPLSSELD